MLVCNWAQAAQQTERHQAAPAFEMNGHTTILQTLPALERALLAIASPQRHAAQPTVTRCAVAAAIASCSASATSMPMHVRIVASCVYTLRALAINHSRSPRVIMCAP